MLLLALYTNAALGEIVTLAYTLTYLLTDVTCLALSLALLVRMSSDLGHSPDGEALRCVACAYLSYLVVDFLWFFTGYALVPVPASVAFAVSALSLFLLAYMYYRWFVYVEVMLESRLLQSRAVRIACRLALLSCVVALVDSWWTGAVFYVDEAGLFQHGPYYMLVLAPSLLFVTVSFASILACIARVRSRIRSLRCLNLMLCGLGPLVAGFSLVVAGVSGIGSLGMLWAVVMAFLSRQRADIYLDALTGLNNRSRADDYFESLSLEVSVDNPIHVYICDLNHFKRINDEFGYAAGDKALLSVASALRMVVEDVGGLVARWGGDEFVLIRTGPTAGTVVAESLANDALKAACERDGLDFTLTLCMGSTDVCDSRTSLDEAVARADKVLYDRKMLFRKRSAFSKEGEK